MSGRRTKIVKNGDWHLYEYRRGELKYYYAEHLCRKFYHSRGDPGVYHGLPGPSACEVCGEGVPDAILALYAFLNA